MPSYPQIPGHSKLDANGLALAPKGVGASGRILRADQAILWSQRSQGPINISKSPMLAHMPFADLTYASERANWDHRDQGRKQTVLTGTNTGSHTGTPTGTHGDTSIPARFRCGPYNVPTPGHGAIAPRDTCQTGTIDRAASQRSCSEHPRLSRNPGAS